MDTFQRPALVWPPKRLPLESLSEASEICASKELKWAHEQEELGSASLPSNFGSPNSRGQSAGSTGDGLSNYKGARQKGRPAGRRERSSPWAKERAAQEGSS